MREEKQQRRLKKELKLLDVYAIATGTTLSAGFFLLPGLAAAQAGPAMIIAYMIAAIPMIPAMFSIVELATAMPRAGGVYYFLDRTLGPVTGMIGGLGTWLALLLKVAFALVGIGAYIGLFFPQLPMTYFALAVAIALAILNILGAGKSGRFQIFLVIFLLSVLVVFIGGGSMELHAVHFEGFFDAGTSSILATSGLVYISYVGITNVASLSEEVQNPERNLPLGVFLALGTAMLVYALGTTVIVGVIPMSTLAGDLTSVATAAELFLGRPGAVLIALAALAAFVSVSNAGMLSASRYPLAMARDHLMPRIFYRLSRNGTPIVSILTTLGMVMGILIFLDAAGIAKLASSFQLLMFALVNLAVIVMRESHIESYDPGYKSPLYPWLQIIGIFSPVVLIVTMGWMSSAFTAGLVIVGMLWYAWYAKGRIGRTGAIYHVFERLGHSRYDGLDSELRGIMKEKGLREEDPFDQIVARSMVIDLNQRIDFVNVVGQVSGWLSRIVPHTPEEIQQQFMEGTRIGATPVTHGVALPHLRVDGIEEAEMILVRARKGIHICFNNPLTGKDEEELVHATFFLVSPERNPSQHLRILAQIAGRVDDESFMPAWDAAGTTEELKEALLHDERSLSLFIKREGETTAMIGRSLRELQLPDGCLVTWLHRSNEVIVPRGSTVLEEGDRITVIGDPSAMRVFRSSYIPEGRNLSPRAMSRLRRKI